MAAAAPAEEEESVAVAGYASWRTLPFILAAAWAVCCCFWRPTSAANTHRYTHISKEKYGEKANNGRQPSYRPAIFIACKCAKGGAKRRRVC